MTAVCDLADDLRDAITEYQVSNDFEQYMQDDLLMIRSTVRSTKGDLRTEL